MPSPYTPITYADFATLATLANSKLSPATPYSFSAFAGSDVISLPTKVTPVANYGSGSFTPGQSVPFWLFGYRTIAGKKTYSYSPATTDITGVTASGVFTLVWSWIAPIGPTAPEGYVAVVPSPLDGGFQYIWLDIGNVLTIGDDGLFDGWKIDQTLNQPNPPNGPAENLPCAHGTWLKEFNLIHHDLFNKMTIFNGVAIPYDSAFLLSGPWCVSVAPKCYLYINNFSIYDNLEFWYSEIEAPTGNQIAPEADIALTHIGVENGPNNIFDWTENVLINGRIVIMSSPQGQAQTDWTQAASDPGIVMSFDAHYVDSLNGTVTAFIFDFTDIQYTLGTPITLTVTPLTGGSVINNGNPNGGGGSIDAVFTGDKATYATSDAPSIHYSGEANKKVSLPNALTAIEMTTLIGGSNIQPAHHRVFCNGVFVANTLPTLGLMTYLDQDLPQYRPRTTPAIASSRRVALDLTQDYIAHVDNRGALYPVFRDTDFTPDSLNGKPLNGSKAWQALGSKFVTPHASVNVIPPSGVTNTLTPTLTFFVADGIAAQDLRLLSTDINTVLYAKTGSAPTVTDFDIMGYGGVWVLASTADPGYTRNVVWHVAILNPTPANISTTSAMVIVDDGNAPNGTFFPTVTDDNLENVAQREGYSYHFSDAPSVTLKPIPLSGYCVYSLTIRRMPVDNGSGIALAPSTGTSALNVDVGIMADFSFDNSGVFEKIVTVTIPAGAAEITTDVFWPVLSGTFVSYQCTEQVMIRVSANFQPLIQSQFDSHTTRVNGASYVTGFYCGLPFYDKNKALLTFIGTNNKLPIVLPISSSCFNDLVALLNLLP